MSRLTYPLGPFLLAALLASPAAAGGAEAPAGATVADGLRMEVVITQVPRPVELTLDGAGGLVVLSHGWRGAAAGEIYRVGLDGPLPVDASRLPRIVIPFSEEPRQTLFGSLGLDPATGDLFLGEENGNRIYRLTEGKQLSPLAVGLQHLVGGGGFAVDRRGHLVVLDYVSQETQRRSESPLPPALDVLGEGDYQGPLVFRVEPHRRREGPRRLDLLPPFFPRGWFHRRGIEPVPRFVAVAVARDGDIFVLASQGEVLRLGADAILRPFARLPSGHYHRVNMVVAPDGSLVVSGGFHVRTLYRIDPIGRVGLIARDLGDPEGVAVDAAGLIYVSETAHHRVIRFVPAP